MNKNQLLIALQAALRAGKAILEVYETTFSVTHKEDHSPLTQADKNAHEIIFNALSKTDVPVLSEEGKEISYEERKSWKELWVVDPLDGTKEFVKRNGEFTVNIAFVRNGFAEGGVIYQPVTDVLYYGNAELPAVKIADASTFAFEDFAIHAQRLDVNTLPSVFTVVASRSHMSTQTTSYVEELKSIHGDVRYISSGSSLKLCMVAENLAHVYPRFAPTMEWDTAAGHAILKAAGKNIYGYPSGLELRYNKPDLLNDWFIAK